MSNEKNPEITSLNADDLDAAQLDDQALEDVAGGECGTLIINCEVYSTSADG